MSLERFLKAQEPIYNLALSEIKSGKKRTHWIWYIFPQISDAGSSRNSTYYRIQSREEAIEYLNHRVLGPRLIEISSALLAHPNRSAFEILGFPDNLKVQSCMTLFHLINPEISIFNEVLKNLYQGKECERTLQITNFSI